MLIFLYTYAFLTNLGLVISKANNAKLDYLEKSHSSKVSDEYNLNNSKINKVKQTISRVFNKLKDEYKLANSLDAVDQIEQFLESSFSEMSGKQHSKKIIVKKSRKGKMENIAFDEGESDESFNYNDEEFEDILSESYNLMEESITKTYKAKVFSEDEIKEEDSTALDDEFDIYESEEDFLDIAESQADSQEKRENGNFKDNDEDEFNDLTSAGDNSKEEDADEEMEKEDETEEVDNETEEDFIYDKEAKEEESHREKPDKKSIAQESTIQNKSQIQNEKYTNAQSNEEIIQEDGLDTIEVDMPKHQEEIKEASDDSDEDYENEEESFDDLLFNTKIITSII